MNANEIYEIIQNNNLHYNYFGLRAVTMNPFTGEHELLNVGDFPGYSYDWNDGDPTDFQLSGTCALKIDAYNDGIEEIEAVIDNLNGYDDRAQVVLIGSLWAEYGSDMGEIVMDGNATVLAEWKKQ